MSNATTNSTLMRRTEVKIAIKNATCHTELDQYRVAAEEHGLMKEYGERWYDLEEIEIREFPYFN